MKPPAHDPSRAAGGRGPRNRRLRLAPALALAALVLLPGGALAQEPAPDWRLGDHGFRFALKSFAKLEPLHKIDDLRGTDPADTVLIVFGSLGCLDEIRGQVRGLKNFVDAGGALLIASDSPDQGRLSRFGVVLEGEVPRLPQPVTEQWLAKFGDRLPENKPPFAKAGWVKARYRGDFQVYWLPKDLWELRWAEPYLGFDDCPLLKGYLDRWHPLFARCTQGLVANRPSVLLLQPGAAVTVLGAYPPFPPVLITPKGHVSHDQAFAVGSPADSGERLLFVSSQTVFCNDLLGRKDIDNWQFTVNTVRWLAENPATGKKRKRVLFLHDGKVVDDFDVWVDELPPMTSRMINNLIRDLEDENFFNLLALDVADRDDPDRAKVKLLRVLLLAGLVLLTGYGWSRYRRARYRRDATVPLVEARLAQTAAEAVPPVVKRDRLTLRGGDFREAARTLARLCFEESPGGRRAARPPQVVGAGRAGDTLAGAVDRLWELAYGTTVEPLSANAFAGLVDLVARVQEALRRGTLQWGTAR
jgi:hypothetical protein